VKRSNYARLSLAEKRAYSGKAIRPGGIADDRPAPPLYRCRCCGVRVTAQDRAGHAQRSHAASGDVAAWFEGPK